MTESAQAAEKVKAEVSKVKDKAQTIVDGISVSIMYIACCGQIVFIEIQLAYKSFFSLALLFEFPFQTFFDYICLFIPIKTFFDLTKIHVYEIRDEN